MSKSLFEMNEKELAEVREKIENTKKLIHKENVKLLKKRKKAIKQMEGNGE